MLVTLILATTMAQPAAVGPPAAAPVAATSPAAPLVATAPTPARTPFDDMVHDAAMAAARHLPIDDDHDRVRRMAASDRDEKRYFNRPGATRTIYESEWTGCRQIARRLATSENSGRWMQAGFSQGGLVGGMFFGLMEAGFAERRARRDIRRQCLLARGWRMVEPDEAGQHRISALSRDERNAYFDRMLGADQVEPSARITRWGDVFGKDSNSGE